MKHMIIFEILQKLRAQPDLMRRVRIFAIVGFLGVLTSGALLIWAGISVINYVASSASHVVHSSVDQGLMKSLEDGFRGLPKMNAINCWGKTQSLFAIQPWLERSALDNLENLKMACLEEEPTVCQEDGCERTNNLIDKGTTEGGPMNKEEGSFI